jgi:hypothetical protein
MADESKKKAYYDSLVRAGVVPPEVSYDAFNLKIRDTNFAKIVYSGLKTASELGIVKDIPSEQQFNSVLQSGEFPTKPEIYKTNQPLPNVGATQTNQTQQTTPTTATETEVVAEEETPQQGTPARRMSPIPQALVQRVQPQTNQPQPTPEETQIAPIDQQAGQVQGGRPISGDVLANAPKQEFQWSGQAPTKPVVQPQTGMPQTRDEGAIQQKSVNPADLALSTLGSAETSLINQIGSELKGIAETGYSLDKKIVGALEGTPFEGGYKAPYSKPEDSWIYQAGQGLQNFTEEYLYRNPEYQGGILDIVAQGLGSVGAIALTGGLNPAGGVVKLGTKAMTNPQLIAYGAKQLFSRPSISGALMMVGQETDEARKLHRYANSVPKDEYVFNRVALGESEEDASKAYDKLKSISEDEVASGMIPFALFSGATEAIPMERLFTRLGKASKDIVISAFKNGGIQGTEEAIQEMIQQTISNVGKGQVYNEAQRLSEGLVESAEGGGATGFVLGSILTALAGKRANIAKAVADGTMTKEEAIAELNDVNKAQTLVNDKLQALDNIVNSVANEDVKKLTGLPESKTFFDKNEASLTNPITTMPTQVETIMDKIDGGILISAESLHEAYQWTNNAVKETLANQTLTPAEKGATLNILNGMLTDIDRANTEGQRFVEQVEEVSVQDRVPAVREGVKPLPQGQAPKGTATPSISQAKAIREENRRKQAGTTTLPSSGQTIVTPAPATETTTTTEVATEPVATTTIKPEPKKVKVLGKEMSIYSNYIPEKAEDVESDAVYSFTADSLDGIPAGLRDVASVNKTEINGVKSENWHASINGSDLLKQYPTTTEPVATGTEVSPAEVEVKLAELPTKTIEAEVVSETPVAVTEANPALADVESTAKALEGVDKETEDLSTALMVAEGSLKNNDLRKSKQRDKFIPIIKSLLKEGEYIGQSFKGQTSESASNSISQAISSAYHSAKAKPESERTAQETELITQVEQLLTPTQDAVQKQTAGQVPVQSGTTSSQEVAKGEPQAEPKSTADKGQAQETGKEEVGTTETTGQEGGLDNLEEKMSKVDFDKLLSEQANKTPEQKEAEQQEAIEQNREEEYQKSSFDKKWAKTYKQAKEKLVEQYNKAKKAKEEWESKNYKSAGDKSVFVGGELEGQDVSVDRINQRRKENGIKNAQSEMDSAKSDLVRLGLSDTEVNELLSPPSATPTLTPVNATDVETITKIENATEKGRELALAKPVNKWVKRAFDTYEDISSRAKKAGIYDGKTLKIGGQEIELDTPAKFKAFLAQSQNNFDAINEAVNKSEIEKLDIEFQELKNKFIRGMGTATMNLNPEQVSILSQMAWNRLEKIMKNLKLSSAGIASQIKKSVDNAVLEINKTLEQSGQTSLNPDKDDITNIINGVRKLAEGIVVPPSQNAGQIGTPGQPSATQSPIYTKEQEELARQMEKKMDEGKPFIARSEPFWTAVKRKVAELRQKLDSPKELLNFAEKMIGSTPGSSYKRTRELPLGRAMEQLRGKARALALPYMERISDILKPIENNLPDFEKYLIYRRIIDRAIQDKLNQDAYNQGLLKKKPTRRTTGGMTETNADVLLNDLRNRIGADLFDKFTQAGDELQQVFDDNLKDLVDAGVLTQDRYNAIKSQNEFYVPFDVVQRDFRGNVITGTEYDRSTAQNQSVVKRIEGMPVPKNAAEADGFIGVVYKIMEKGDIDADSYYYLATNKITDARNAGNITQQEYENLMDALSEPGLELHSPLNKALNIINASQYQVARQGYMNDIDRLVDADTNNDYFKRLEDGDKLPSGMAIVTYYKDGVQQRVAVDEKLKQAIDTMTNPELNAFEKFLKSVSFPFKIAATSASITFLPVNFVIDLTRSLTSKAGLGSGATVTERAASVVQIPVIYSEALMNAIIGNLLNTKLGNVLNLKSITPNFMHEQYEDWRKSPSYSEGSYLGHLVDRLKSGRTKSEIEDAKFLETVQRRTQTILGNEKTAKAIANAVLGTKQKTRMTVDGVMDIVNLISKMLENSHKIYGYTKLSGTETGVRKGIDRYIGGYIDKLHGRKKLTQAELENALDEVTDEVLNNIGSPNFEQIPPNMRAASVIIPFLGAAVKGNMTDVSRVLNSVNAGASKKERLDALAFTARNGAVFLVPAFITGLTMALKDDDDESKKMYDEMDENSKWSNSIIPIERNVDGKEGQFDFITIPIRGVPVIFNSIGRASGQALGMAMKEKLTKEELKNISKDVLLSSFSSMMAFNLADKTYLSNINPETGERKETRKEEELLNRSMSFASGLNPVIKYWPERWANKNFFGKYSIEPENIRGRRLKNAILNEVIDPETGKPISPSLLKNKFTPEYAVTLSQKLERNGIRITPMVIDHFFDTFLAGAPEKFDVGASELMKRRFLWKERKLAYGEKPKN